MPSESTMKPPEIAMLPSMRREIFALDEGDVILTFPDNLSADSYEDLEAYLQLFLRKARRRATSDQRDRESAGDPKSLDECKFEAAMHVKKMETAESV